MYPNADRIIRVISAAAFAAALLVLALNRDAFPAVTERLNDVLAAIGAIGIMWIALRLFIRQ